MLIFFGNSGDLGYLQQLMSAFPIFLPASSLQISPLRRPTERHVSTRGRKPSNFFAIPLGRNDGRIGHSGVAGGPCAIDRTVAAGLGRTADMPHGIAPWG
jgi:hypothetical protein